MGTWAAEQALADDLVERSPTVVARDFAGRPVRVEGLASRPDGAFGDELIDHLSNIHPSDRPAAARAWAQVIREPDEIVTAEVRIHQQGSWYPYELRYLNLLDVPAYGVVLTGARQLSDRGEQVTDPASSTAIDAPWAMLKLDQSGVVLAAEGLVEQLYGCSPDSFIGTNGLDCIHPDDQAALLAAWIDVVERRPKGRALRQRILRRDGTSTWVLTTLGQTDPEGPVFVHDLDITAQLAAEEALEANEERVKRLADELPTAVLVCAPDGRVLYASPRLCDLVGSDPSHLSDFLDDGAVAEWRDQHATADSAAGFQLESTCPDGIHLSVRVGPRQRDGSAIVAVEDASASYRWRDEAHHDGLTSLLNVRGLELGFEQLPNRAGSVVAFVDLDRFKTINDTHGHPAGDLVLRSVGAALTEATRPDDLVGRCGGDEFVVIATVPHGREEDFEARLRRAVERADEMCGHSLSASVGSVRVWESESLACVLERADREMYREKRSRRR